MPTCNNKDKSQTYHAKYKKLDGHTMYASISVTLWRRQNYRERKQISSCQGFGTKEENRISKEQMIYLGCQYYSHNILMVNT